MERIKERIISNTSAVNQEIKDITIKFNQIRQQNEEAVKVVMDLEQKELSRNKALCLNITELQHTIIRKLLFLNLELEELVDLQLNLTVNCESDKSFDLNSITTNKIIKKTKSIEEVKELQKKNASTDSVSESSIDGMLSENGNKADHSDLSEKDIMNLKDSDTPLPLSITENLKKYNLQRERTQSYISIPMPDFSFKKSSRHVKSDMDKKNNDSTDSIVNSEQYPDRRKKPKLKKANREYVKTENGNLKDKSSFKSQEPYVDLKCIVCCIKTPSEFYINAYNQDQLNMIDNLSDTVSKIYGGTESPFKSKQEAKDTLGNYCLTYVEEYKNWYRSQVTNWHMKSWGYREDITTIYLIDYGYSINVSYTFFRSLDKLPDEYKNLPALAMKCSLAHLYPVKAENEEDLTGTWPNQSIKTFKNLIGEENDKTFKIVYCSCVNNVWHIDLVEAESNDNETIGQKLLDKGLAMEVIVNDME